MICPPHRGGIKGEVCMGQPEKHIVFYNRTMQPRANALRKVMTKAEACLWKYSLRAGQMKGYTFNRQRPVLKYIADFMCKPLCLIIEVDGITHNLPNALARDSVRQKEIESAGFTVIRFSDNEVLNEMESVRRSILSKVVELEKNLPLPPQRGGQVGAIAR